MAKSRRKPARAPTSNGSASPSLSSTSAPLPSTQDQRNSNRDSIDADEPSTSTSAIPKIEEESDLPSKTSEGDDDSGGATGPDADDPPQSKSAARPASQRPRSRSTKSKGPTSAPVSSASSTKPTSSTAASRTAAAKKDKPLKIEEADYEEREKRSLRATSSRTATRKIPVEEPEPLEEDDDGDEDGGDSSEGVTRCVCDEDTEEMSSKLMIQCDTCKCWQHGSCVGLNNEKDCPDRYFCELCRPNWHGPGGLLRKTHRKATPAASHHRSPSAAPRFNKPRESADAALVAAFLAAEQSVGGAAAAGMSGESENERSPSAAPTAASGAAKEHGGKKDLAGGDASVELKAPKKRSTMNSRDAAYDDAIAMSILGPGSAAMRARLEKARGDGDRSGSNGGDREDDSADDSSDRPRRSASRESHHDEGKVSTAESTNSHASKRRRISPDGAAVAIVTPEEDATESNPPPPPPPSVPADEVADEPEPTDVMDVDPPVVQPEIVVELAPTPVPSPPPPTKEPNPTPVEEEEPSEPSKEVSPVPLAAPRAKHPNQYTYRPKNGPAVSKASRASPVKRGAGASNGNGNHGHGHGHGHNTGGNTPNMASERSQRQRAERDWAGVAELGPSGWGLPDHLRHLSHLLPSPLPLPLNVPIPVRLSSDSSSSSAGSSSSIEATHQEPATRVKFPNKRMTLPEMKKRAKTVLEYLTRIQIEMSDSNRRTEALLAAVSGGRPTTAKARGGTPVVPLVESMTMMDSLTKDLILFQHKFET